ncbi:MAG TPA: 30S ribosomal protein S13 [Planctomycetota bacterium]|jgi:small subunit ribosomal protein S13|nr:30S ribosomal protein S13 [Planctomycetota bacterium]
MARVAGIEIPAGKQAWVSLTYIFGIGNTLSRRILKDANVPENLKVKDLSEDQLSRINSIVDKGYTVEGSLRRILQQNIQRLKEIACYRGARHRRNLPVRGQRTRSNARTRKGPRKTVAGKKIAKVQG